MAQFTEESLQKYNDQKQCDDYAEKINAIITKKLATFELIKKELVDDFSPIDKTNIVAETNKNIGLYHKYITQKADEQMYLQKIKSQRDTIEAELFDFYRNWSDISAKLKSESAIKNYVEGHSSFANINRLVNTIEVIIEYYDNIITAFRDRGFAIKNVIESIKIELGMM